MIKKILSIALLLLSVSILFTGCATTSTTTDEDRTKQVANTLKENQQTPTDIEYSLERYNLIKRAYWVNGQREKANSLPCQIEKPLGYIIIFTETGAVVGRFVVDGKVSSLNSYLTPESENYAKGEGYYSISWLSDVDGSYGVNDDGIFFFTTDGKYVEWNGTYLYSDIPFEVSDPVIKYEVN